MFTTGPIPPQLTSLVRLKSCLLFSNQLTGNLPPEMSRLTSLQVLRLDNNRLEGMSVAQLSLSISSVCVSHTRTHTRTHTHTFIRPNRVFATHGRLPLTDASQPAHQQAHWLYPRIAGVTGEHADVLAAYKPAFWNYSGPRQAHSGREIACVYLSTCRCGEGTCVEY